MQTSALFQTAAEIFHSDPRVRAMPYSEHDGEYVHAYSHHLEEGEEAPAGYAVASLFEHNGGFVACFPSTDSFLDGPSAIFWSATGVRTDYFMFPAEDEKNARPLSAHETMRYTAHQSKVRSPAQAVAA